jgi:universal stress protein A
MADYQRILLAADFHDDSRAVWERALAMSRASGASLALLHVVESVPVETGNELMVPPSVPVESGLIESAEERIQALGEEFGIPEQRRYVRVGHTKREILAVAEEQASDLIVVGSHGRHGLALILGSTANAVLHGAPCDVLAVRI